MKGVDVAWLLRGDLELGAVLLRGVTVFSKGPLDGRLAARRGRAGDCEASQEAIERWGQGDASKIRVQVCSAQGPSEARGRGCLPVAVSGSSSLWLDMDSARAQLLFLISLIGPPDRALCPVPCPAGWTSSPGRVACTVPTSGNGQAEAWCCLQDEGVEGAQGPASLGHRVPPTPTPADCPVLLPFYLPPLGKPR